MTRLILCVFLLLPLAGCGMPWPRGASSQFACSSDLVKQTMAHVGTGQRVPARVLDAVFARLDAQSRTGVRETKCEMSVVSLRYAKPQRMQFVAWFNTGRAGHPRVSQDPRQTQIGNRLGYVGQTVSAPWPGMGVTAHRLLLADVWRGMPSNQAPRTFYLVRAPDPPVRNLTLRRFRDGSHVIFVEQWRGLWYGCPATVSCPLPNTNPRFFARYTAALRVDSNSGLPISLTTVAQRPDRVRGRFRWGRVEPVAQSTFHYGGDFSIGFVKG